MTRTVADAAVLLGAMMGVDADDTATRDSARRGSRDHTKSLDPNGLRGAYRSYATASSIVSADAIAEAAIADMKKQGADRRPRTSRRSAS
jgi:amidase